MMRIRLVFLGILGAAAAILGAIVMLLWNYIAPVVFAGRTITYLQAVALLVLARILVGGLPRGPGRGNYWRGGMRRRWATMTPEQREMARQRWGARHEEDQKGPAASKIVS